MLEGRNFDPKAAAILVDAFKSVVADLRLRSVADRERAAKVVIQLAARRTDLDAATLRDEAAAMMQKEIVIASG